MPCASHRVIFVAAAITTVFLVRFLWTQPEYRPTIPGRLSGGVSEALPTLGSKTIPAQVPGGLANSRINPRPKKVQMKPECAKLPLLDDVLVVMKTGVTAVKDRMPIHLSTTLSCIPHYVVYSDLEEDVAGQHVFDALDDVREEVRHKEDEFDLYNRIKAHGRKGIKPIELVEGKGGSGWKLDKWKFLPLVDKALAHRPTAKWFIFVEADTYIVWPNMLDWLSHLNASEPLYIGAPTQIGASLFAHGGSGYVASAPAMKLVSERRNAQLEAYDKMTAEEWAGDCVLGRTMKDVGVDLLWSWPLIQDRKPMTINHAAEGYSKRLWCYPAVSYHHVTSEDVKAIWRFEQDWNQQHRSSSRSSTRLRHRDVFRKFIMPQLQEQRDDWDNLSSDEPITLEAQDDAVDHKNPSPTKAAKSFEACRRVCQNQHDCMQFSFVDKKCVTSRVITLGKKAFAAPGNARSGWMMDRVRAFDEGMKPCGDEEWILS
ncbi:MAG: hypothetical protein M1825_001731 [Sarcosagium campestre]|nr:MAG: hypothetical protein M1825_001731 [Sarcosagium campestre]